MMNTMMSMAAIVAVIFGEAIYDDEDEDAINLHQLNAGDGMIKAAILTEANLANGLDDDKENLFIMISIWRSLLS